MKAQKSFRTILSKWQKQDKQNQEADDVASMSIVSIAKRPSRQHSSPEQPIKEDQVFDGEQSSSRVTRQSSSSRVLKQVSSRRINRKNSSRRFLGRFLSRKNVSENSATASDEIVTIEEGIEEECAEILSEPFHDYYKLGEEVGARFGELFLWSYSASSHAYCGFLLFSLSWVREHLLSSMQVEITERGKTTPSKLLPQKI
jgi:hypothetical protein